jgi:NADH-quinone oxidoreductase subunit J
MVFSKNPLNACLFLILTFFCSSCILFLSESDYLPIIFVLIYVGAIIVLFLFIIMMLNLRTLPLNNRHDHNQYLLILIIFTTFFILQMLFALKHQASQFKLNYAFFNFTILSNSFTLPLKTLGQFPVINDIGILLYSKFFVSFVLAAFALLLAMIGAIILVLKRNFKGKTLQAFQQILRKDNLKYTLIIDYFTI